MNQSSRAVTLLNDRLQNYIDGLGGSKMTVNCRGDIDDDAIDKVISRLENGGRLPNTFHFLSGYITIFRTEKSEEEKDA